jgi:myo-inositol-1(or 4)-monophosphatase
MPDFVAVSEEAARAGGEVLLAKWPSFQVREKAAKDLVTEADVASQEAVRQVVMKHCPTHGFIGEEGANIRGVDCRFRWIVDPLDGTANYVHHVPEFAVSVALEQDGELVAATVYNPVSCESFSAGRGRGAHLNGQCSPLAPREEIISQSEMSTLTTQRLQVSAVREIQAAMVAASFAAGVQRDSPEIANFINVLAASQTLRRTGSAALNLAYVAAGRYDAYWATSTKVWDIAAGVLLVLEAGGVVTGIDGGPLDISSGQFVAAANEELHAAMRGLICHRQPPSA